MKHANLNMNRYPGLKNSDVFYQMIDLDKGVYGHAFLVSLFIHVNDLLDDYAEICFGEGGFLIMIDFFLKKITTRYFKSSLRLP